MSASAPNEDVVPAKHYAALEVALGRLRGLLYDVVDGDYNKEDLQQLLDATSTAQIAKAIGKKEGDLVVDWNRYLSDEEKHGIGRGI